MIVPVFRQDAVRVAFRVVELPVLHRPDEGKKADEAQKQRDGDQDAKDFHRFPYFSRSAFIETVIEESDIASAAASGVAEPISASGTAITL